MSKSIDREFRNRKEWRMWLEGNHSSEKEVWAIIHKKKSEKEGLKYQEAVEEAVCFGWIDSKMQRVDEFKFRLRFSPRKKNSIWSKNNKELAETMIRLGKMKRSGVEKIDEAKRNGKWDLAYSSKEPLKIPKDLLKVLKENKIAWKNFAEFSNSTKLRFIYWIESAKRNETRKKRITEVVNKANKKSKF